MAYQGGGFTPPLETIKLYKRKEHKICQEKN